MNRRLPAAALTVLATAAPAAAATRGYQISDFARVRVEGPLDVHVRTGVAPGARASGPQRLVDRVIVEQHGDTVVVRPDRATGMSWSWGKDDPLVVELGTHQLGAATLTGSGELSIDKVRGDALTLELGGSGDLSVGAVDVQALKMVATSSGDLTVAGRATRADAALVGSGDLRGEGLTADAVTVRLIGSGNLALAARRTATVTASGSGDATIAGSATCKVNRTGSGDVRCGGRTFDGD